MFYSDGYDYFPFRKSFKLIDREISNFRKVLVLGAGIGSVGMILDKEFPDHNWELDYVDINDTILEWCRNVMEDYPSLICHYIHQDASRFIQQADSKYDLICVDVFDEHVVPMQLLTEQFIEKVMLRLHEDGIVVLNIMFSSELQEIGYRDMLSRKFSDYKSMDTAKNKVFMIRKSAMNQV